MSQETVSASKAVKNKAFFIAVVVFSDIKTHIRAESCIYYVKICYTPCKNPGNKGFMMQR